VSWVRRVRVCSEQRVEGLVSGGGAKGGWKVWLIYIYIYIYREREREVVR